MYCKLLVSLFALVGVAKAGVVANGGVSSTSNSQDNVGNYEFHYEIVDPFGATNERTERGDSYGNKYGTYALSDLDGRIRRVSYIADAGGFRVGIDSNERGVQTSQPASVAINKYEEPVQAVAVKAVAPAAVAVRTVTPVVQAAPAVAVRTVTPVVQTAPAVALKAPVVATYANAPVATYSHAPIATYAHAPVATYAQAPVATYAQYAHAPVATYAHAPSYTAYSHAPIAAYAPTLSAYGYGYAPSQFAVLRSNQIEEQPALRSASQSQAAPAPAPAPQAQGPQQRSSAPQPAQEQPAAPQQEQPTLRSAAPQVPAPASSQRSQTVNYNSYFRQAAPASFVLPPSPTADNLRRLTQGQQAQEQPALRSAAPATPAPTPSSQPAPTPSGPSAQEVAEMMAMIQAAQQQQQQQQMRQQQQQQQEQMRRNEEIEALIRSAAPQQQARQQQQQQQQQQTQEPAYGQRIPLFASATAAQRQQEAAAAAASAGQSGIPQFRSLAQAVQSPPEPAPQPQQRQLDQAVPVRAEPEDTPAAQPQQGAPRFEDNYRSGGPVHHSAGVVALRTGALTARTLVAAPGAYYAAAPLYAPATVGVKVKSYY